LIESAGQLISVRDASGSAVQQAREAEAIIRGFYAGSHVLMGVAEIRGGRLFSVHANRATGDFFGVDRVALNNQPAAELGTVNEALWIEQYHRARAEGRSQHFDYEHRRADGTRWLSATVAFLFETPAGAARYSYICQDVTELKLAMQRSEATARRLRAIFDQTSAGIVLADLQGRLLEANDRYARIIGRDPREIAR
jgi:PAS domain S-box-containing protein